MRQILALILLTSSLATPVLSESREVIGIGRLGSNDAFWDENDRWRTGSFVFSVTTGREDYTGDEAFGDIIEYRFGAQVISPMRFSKAPGDRPYVGTISLGAHTHFAHNETNFSLGADLMAIGPQTGLSEFHNSIHEALDDPPPPYFDQQLGDAFFINGTAEVTRTFELSSRATVRPFVEGIIGAEDLLRVGADVIIGEVGQSDLMLRDAVTGHLYRGSQASQFGLSYMFGADIATVFDSAFLPADQGYAVSETRSRVRAGVLLQYGERLSFFYGATYLSEEFVGQLEGQVVGSFVLDLDF